MLNRVSGNESQHAMVTVQQLAGRSSSEHGPMRKIESTPGRVNPERSGGSVSHQNIVPEAGEAVPGQVCANGKKLAE